MFCWDDASVRPFSFNLHLRENDGIAEAQYLLVELHQLCLSSVADRMGAPARGGHRVVQPLGGRDRLGHRGRRSHWALDAMFTHAVIGCSSLGD